MTSVETTDHSIQVSRTIDAPPERTFALIADPDRHPDLDASGMVRDSRTHLAIEELGDVFTMDMHNEALGDYTVDNHVVVYESDVALGWAPGPVGEPPAGHTWTYRLAPDGDSTVVTLTYDWSAITDEELLQYFPVVDADALAASLDLLAEALA
ncbi:SRPBCC family protein [Actinomycetospora endophytica]|uniref:SRPBCC family protein n=1 Tax=Actinomycetospora endophytica TaxID=2291215 RepID=A0ABS8P6Q8_9PSEU|nr:SRPBCC family protein [Actinomycetospora endophytica]MCD2193923.1 SRPBCC family protein [Actinomycetospora endophytica]